MASAAKGKASKTIDKWKRKKWHVLVAPKMFREVVIGESITDDPSLLIGKTITQNLMTLTNDLRKKDCEVTFKVVDYKEQAGITEIIKFEILPSAIKRRVRRARDRLDDSFLAKTQDDKLVRVKPFIVTISNTKSSIQRDLRAGMRRFLVAYINSTTFETAMTDIISSKLQKDMHEKLRKVYPLKFCEIRKLEIAPETRKNKNVATIDGVPEVTPDPEDDIPIMSSDEEDSSTPTDDDGQVSEDASEDEAADQSNVQEDQDSEKTE